MSRYITEQEARAIFKDEMRRMVGTVVEPQNIEWLPTSANGTLRLGFEVQDRRSPESQNCSYYFSIPACLKRLNTPPEKRA